MNTFDRTVFQLCEEIDWLQGQLAASQKKTREYEKLYLDLLERDIKHGEHMMGQLLLATLKMDRNGAN